MRVRVEPGRRQTVTVQRPPAVRLSVDRRLTTAGDCDKMRCADDDLLDCCCSRCIRYQSDIEQRSHVVVSTTSALLVHVNTRHAAVNGWYNYSRAFNFFRVLFLFLPLLWPPYGIGQAIIFLPCDFYLLLLSFFPRLMSAVGDWMSTHMVWP